MSSMSRMCVVMMSCCMIGLASFVLAADQPAPVQNAIARAARLVGVAPDQVTVVSVQGVDWPDTSLGCPRPGHMYAQVITQGYRVILEAKGQRFEYHTDMGNRAVLATVDGRAATDEGGTTRAPAVAVETTAEKACREDLAKRLNIPAQEISVLRTEAVEFPDASLGLAKPDELYAQVLTPGQIIHLMARNTPYLYTSAGKGCHYGGPAQASQYSALYLEPVADEPNLNGNLIQVSLMGTNPRVMLGGVSDFRPQLNGAILASRRTSRSGFDLIYLPAGATDETKLASAFAFGDAAVNADGTKWAAITRPGVGGGWQVSWGSLTGNETPGHVDFPGGGQPRRLYWHMTNPVLVTLSEAGLSYLELVLKGGTGEWRKAQGYYPPPTEEFMLNKSETLVVTTEEDAGKPVTRVTRRWFTGEDKPVAQIANFAPGEMTLTPDKRFLLLSAENMALIVDVATGEILKTAEQVHGPVRLLLAPPQGWLWRHLAEQNPQ